MKKYLFLLLAVFMHIGAIAVPAYPDSLCVIQPNGDTLWTYLHGDEFYHWRSTIDGYVIIRDSNNYFHYAIVDADSLCPSGYIAHNLEERDVFEQEQISAYSSLVRDFLEIKIQEAHNIESNDTTLLLTDQYVSSSGTNHSVVGIRRILTILMEFKDYPFTKTRAEFDSLMNQRNGNVGPNYGSVRQYYLKNSYGYLDVISTVVGPFEADFKRKFYSYKNDGNFLDGTTDIRMLVREAIYHAKKQVDFSTLDGNHDGFVDCVHVVFAGEGRSSGSSNSYIWEHKYKLLTPITSDGKKAKEYIITSELYRDGKLASVGTICHEIGHILGAPDYYDQDVSNGDFSATGGYDIMCDGSWNDNGNYPAHHNPYTKCYTFGWDTPTLISSETKNYTLSSTTKSKNNIYRINTSTAGEYFLLENRTTENFDAGIPNGGLLVYHIHKDLESYISNNKRKINDTHPMKLYLVNASALSNPNNSPSSYGTWYASRAFPGYIGNKTLYTSSTIPSAKAWSGAATNVDICLIRKSSNGDITFTVNPEIQGPSQLCGTQDYCISGTVPYTDTITWSYTTDIAESNTFPALRFEEGTEGACVPIQRGYMSSWFSDTILPMEPIINPTNPIVPGIMTFDPITPEIDPSKPYVDEPYVGTTNLYATIKSKKGTYQIKKEITLPQHVTPSLAQYAQESTIWKTNQTRTLYETACDSINPEYIKWYVCFPNTTTEEVFSGRSITLTPTQEGDMTVRVVNDCGCETSNSNTYTYTIVDEGHFSHPNPITNATIEVDMSDLDEMEGEYTIELWHETYGRVRCVTVDSENVQIDVSDLPSSWYQLVLLLNGTIIESSNVFINNN